MRRNTKRNLLALSKASRGLLKIGSLRRARHSEEATMPETETVEEHIPKLQLLEEDSDDSPATQAWDKSLPKRVLELAARMATVAQSHSILSGIVE